VRLTVSSIDFAGLRLRRIQCAADGSWAGAEKLFMRMSKRLDT